MDRQRFEREHGERLEELRAARGDCPPSERLLEWIEGALTDEEAAGIERHVTLCSVCSESVVRAREDEPPVDDVSWRRIVGRLEQRPAPWSRTTSKKRAGWLAAAAAALLTAVVFLYRPGGEETLSPASVSTTRDAEITLIAPRGEVPDLVEFLWRGLPAPVRYRVEVAAGGEPPRERETLWRRISADHRLPVDDSLREIADPGRKLRWRVAVLDAEGRELSRSEWVEFVVAD